MSQPYIGEIRMFGGNFPPVGWAFCDGQLIPISENDALFVVIGTTFGGDGEETFALPNLQSRHPMHSGNGHILGESGGTESVTLTVNQIPIHTHAALGTKTEGSETTPQNHYWAGSTAKQFTNAAPAVAMAAGNVAPVGGSQPHENMMPYLVVSFIISLFGLFPSPT